MTIDRAPGAVNVPGRNSGFQTLCPGTLSRRTELLIAAGFGRSKRLWVLDSVEQNDSQTLGASEYVAVGSGTLFLLAATSLYAECRSILGRAISHLHT